MACRREAIAPLQTAEAVEIKKRSDAFAAKVDSYRRFFQTTAPFAVAEPQLAPDHVSPELLHVLHNEKLSVSPFCDSVLALL